MIRIYSGFLLLIVFILGSLSCSPGAEQEKKETDQKPNILFIFSDDHAYQAMGAYGNKIAKTPNIDRLAREGALFTNTFITNSICGPSRAILLTGKYSHLNGYTVNEGKFNPEQFVFPELLQKSGYQTAWVGKMHLGAIPHGLDYWNILPGQGHYYNPDFIGTKLDTTRVNGYVTNLITDFSMDFLSKRDTTKPFFLVVGQKATHREWLPALEDLGAYDSVNFPLPATFYDDYKDRLAAEKQDMTIDKTMRLQMDLKVHIDYEKARDYSRLTPEQKKLFYDYYENKVSREFDSKKLSGKELVEWKYQRYMKDYLSTANALDRNIGRILDYLDKTGLAKNTIVLYASDQGFYLGEHGWFDKRFMYEQSLRTAFMMRYPGVVKPGSVFDDFVIGQDWSASILDAAGIQVPEEIQGNSIMPLVKGQATDSWRKEIYYHYYEFPQPHHVYPHIGIRTQQYKLIRFYGGIDTWELYDLKNDPDEVKNIYAQKEKDPLVTDLKAALKKLIIQYKDTAALKLL